MTYPDQNPFLQNVGYALDDSMRVVLPNGESADVAMNIIDNETGYHIIARGIARYSDGQIIGESHTQSAPGDDGWFSPHSHDSLQCKGFEWRDGLFIPADSVVDPEDHMLIPEHLGDEEHAAQMLAARITFRLRWAGLPYKAHIQDKRLHAVKWAKSLRGDCPGQSRLFGDLALQTALDERIAESA